MIGDDEVSARELEDAAEIVRRAIVELLESGGLQAPPTFFEAATAVAFELFRRADVRVAVLEVGLGGRLDATNVVLPVAAAITSIDFDHESLLGPTLDAIAFEKAGIIKPGIPVVCGPLPADAESVIQAVCEQQGARFISARAADAQAGTAGSGFLALRGAHQRDNAGVAARLLREVDALGIAVDDRAIAAGLSQVVWPGRLELFAVGQTEVLLDAAHNPAAARALARYLRDVGWAGCPLVFGVLRDKHADAMLAELAPVCGTLICTTPDSDRALAAADTAAAARGVASGWTVAVVPDPRAALDVALQSYSRIVAAGSIFLIGPLRGILRSR